MMPLKVYDDDDDDDDIDDDDDADDDADDDDDDDDAPEGARIVSASNIHTGVRVGIQRTDLHFHACWGYTPPAGAVVS